MRQRIIQLTAIVLFGAGAHAAAAAGAPPTFALQDPSVAEYGMVLRLPGGGAHESEHEIMLRNADAAVSTKFWLPSGSKRPAFLYVDVGATDSSLRWQGLAGVHGSHGIDLLGGWRHVTYHYTPGFGLDSLEFDGPFLGATLAL
jgi:hypothetical protein